MARFIVGEELSGQINHVLGGQDIRCAVAFWGTGAEALLDPAHARIICDVSLGGTAPEALRQLGAPDNPNLRHIPFLHAKVYISERGAVVGSPNASQNGIGFSGAAGLIEAGVFLAVDSEPYNHAVRWFEKQWSTAAKQVDASALACATKRFRRQGTQFSRPSNPESLLDLLVDAPELFADIGFVLARKPLTNEDKETAAADVQAAHPNERHAIAGFPGGGIFRNWSKNDLKSLRMHFIEFWMPSAHLRVFGRSISYIAPEKGTFMARADWRAIRQMLRARLPSQERIAKADAPKIRQLLDKHGGKIYNAPELIAALHGISA